MYIICRNIWSKNLKALYNIKNYINHIIIIIIMTNQQTPYLKVACSGKLSLVSSISVMQVKSCFSRYERL